MDKCPYCGGDSGLYSKERQYEFDQYYRFDGEPDGYSELSSRVYRKTIPLYCQDCNKYIGKYDKLFGKETP